MNNSGGFTLVELMVALAIFAVTATVILQQSSQSVRQQAQLEELTLATWVAENQLAELRLNGRQPSLGQNELKTTFANRPWKVSLDTTQSSTASIRKVKASVAPQNTDFENQPVATLSGYFGESQ